ncbi:MAG: tRNA preQ1(34) S-adenosylmethionine ribosyltransferase-isomerase QueA [Oligoflexales bacterium]|nr:tRNA preQ1(34) S-adenosylmethionine ribosyltransferase-isomerase QueA [Oligoflexales bacterium]
MSDEEILRLKDFYFSLPKELIAQYPLERRDESKLLVRDYSGAISNNYTKNLADLLPENSLIVVNDSKVFPSRILGELKSGGKVEIFLLEPMESINESNVWKSIGKPFKKLRPGTIIDLYNGCVAKIESHNSDKSTGTPTFNVKFNLLGEDFNTWLEHHGYIPLPPYIERKNPKPALQSDDSEIYQTIYAKNRGSVAAPTAGFHFTGELLNKLSKKNISIVPVTLHVGAGTFLPVKTENISDHKMHEERYFIPQSTYRKLLYAKHKSRMIIAVGTTTLRCLESFFSCEVSSKYKHNTNCWNKTDIFIRPNKKTDTYKPAFINALMTNFHQPESTLFMLISALLGLEEARRVYNYAIIKKYRFFSYGDSCLFWLT